MLRFIIAAYLLFAFAVQAQEQIQSIKLFSHSLTFKLPEHWKQTSFDESNGVISAEFLPSLENLNEWTSLLCIQSFKVSGEGILPATFLDSLATNYGGSCQGKMTYEKLGEFELNGHKGVHGILGCSSIPNQHQSLENSRPFYSEPAGEVGYFAVTSLPGELLLLHKSMRGEVFTDDKIPLSGKNYEAFVADIMPLKIP